MNILGIETSCDETSAAVVKDGETICANSTLSSLSFHRRYGGVIPEIAFRMHLDYIVQVVDAALDDAGVTLSQIGVIGVTHDPGLTDALYAPRFPCSTTRLPA